jgi:hypothetical protein
MAAFSSRALMYWIASPTKFTLSLCQKRETTVDPSDHVQDSIILD